MQRITWVFAVVLAVVLGQPAHAGKWVIGSNTGDSGVVASRDLPVMFAIPGYDVDAECAFSAVLLPNNTFDVAYAGRAEGRSVVVPPRLPQQTVLECRISNEIGNVANFAWSNGSSMSVHAETVSGWPVSPITVCLRGHVFWGPTDAVDVDTGYSCKAPGLTP